MIGFTIPLLMWLGLLGIVGVALLVGPPLSRIAANVCRASYTSQGRTITYTIAGMLGVLLLNPLYEAYRLSMATSRGEDDKAHEQAEHELSTMLSAVLLLGSELGLFFVRRLGQAVADCDRMTISEQALLRQVKNMQAQFAGGVGPAGAAPKEQPGATAAAAAAAAAAAKELQKEVEELRTQAVAALRAQRQAETNLSALKTQCRGLENEYDRVAAENQELHRRLQRAGLEPAPGNSNGNGGEALGKKDE